MRSWLVAVGMLLFLSGCDFDLNPGFDVGPITLEPLPCSELAVAHFSWTLRGFEPADILDSEVSGQSELTALMREGQSKVLRVTAGSALAIGDCSSKVSGVEWHSSNEVVARLEIAADPRIATLVALQAGDTVVSATLTFHDGTAPVRALPWSFTNARSPVAGHVTIVRVVP